MVWNTVMRDAFNRAKERALQRMKKNNDSNVFFEKDSFPGYNPKNEKPKFKLTDNFYANYELKKINSDGVSEQPKPSRYARNVREIRIGFDFGTSTVKIVVSESTGHIYAVPFFEKSGVDAYLLPCVLFESNGIFSLFGGDVRYSDLKKNLNSYTSEGEVLITIAFLALVIRHVRAYIFDTTDLMNVKKLIWSLNLGMPSIHITEEGYKSDPKINYLRFITISSWLVASESSTITCELVKEKFDFVREHQKKEGIQFFDQSIFPEINVIPELSAQIYAFVRSDSFDPDAKNIFAMVDVGASTLDTAMFHVVRRNAKWSFYFYSNNVQPLGVYNLHAKRIEWWTQKMKQKGYDDALNVLRNYKNLNYQNIPEKFTDYFDNVMINSDPEKDGPDFEFYRDVRQQVTGMIYNPYKEKRLNKNQIRDTPVFYCGGGMRMQFYQRLKCDLKNVPGTSWLSTNEITLKLPEKFDVHDISNCDFDRLSVAYGLSTISVDDIFKVEPLPNNEMQIVSGLYKERFISKDMI